MATPIIQSVGKPLASQGGLGVKPLCIFIFFELYVCTKMRSGIRAVAQLMPPIVPD